VEKLTGLIRSLGSLFILWTILGHSCAILYGREDVPAAIDRAKARYPEPIAALIERELLTWKEFGFRIDFDNKVTHLISFLLNDKPQAKQNEGSAAPKP
jgi:hypothetical protein